MKEELKNTHTIFKILPISLKMCLFPFQSVTLSLSVPLMYTCPCAYTHSTAELGSTVYPK